MVLDQADGQVGEDHRRARPSHVDAHGKALQLLLVLRSSGRCDDQRQAAVRCADRGRVAQAHQHHNWKPPITTKATAKSASPPPKAQSFCRREEPKNGASAGLRIEIIGARAMMNPALSAEYPNSRWSMSSPTTSKSNRCNARQEDEHVFGDLPCQPEFDGPGDRAGALQHGPHRAGRGCPLKKVAEDQGGEEGADHQGHGHPKRLHHPDLVQQRPRERVRQAAS
eukprot:CAMPEP_0181521066 /NCGR_PEP_ID=MMETSP1110-20121109/66646_1 /TAXON_ID=174948 /ORGANISM="Symbiodinium sp., Strain CCMP421" /LENGTH=224 /DNA_ID=CAMNT_0023651599 /DNA_START=326 /DNA_END=1000 /DNA_ORIENTATION=+